MDRLSRWGVGPSIVLAAVAYAAVAGFFTWLSPEVCLIRVIPRTFFLIAGGLLLVIGVPMLIVSASALNRNYDRDQLATTGIYGLVRNPIYSAWILFLLPGLALWSGSWPLLLTPVVAYVVFKLRIGREDVYLERRFGDAYRRYKSEVNELVPLPRGGRSR